MSVTSQIYCSAVHKMHQCQLLYGIKDNAETACHGCIQKLIHNITILLLSKLLESGNLSLG